MPTAAQQKSSGARGDRTLGLYHAMVALSQLSYSPKKLRRIRVAPKGFAKTPEGLEAAPP
jgi:hypothetical protein